MNSWSVYELVVKSTNPCAMKIHRAEKLINVKSCLARASPAEDHRKNGIRKSNHNPHSSSLKVIGRGSRVVKLSDRGWPCQEFDPSTTKDPPCRAAMYVESVESSNVLPLMWCSS
ncbi:hypothetical protein TNCV_4606761 [Trichonephila clavipes]|nr:hypothetical protein TNCV_4606761 [Trichonephila clavipes]